MFWLLLLLTTGGLTGFWWLLPGTNESTFHFSNTIIHNREKKSIEPTSPFALNAEAATCGRAKTNIISCNTSEEKPAGVLAEVLKIFLMALSVVVGIAAVGGIAWASVLYAKAQDNESNVQQAKELIRNVVIGILLYVFMIAIINWLVPGGVIQ